MPPARDHVHTLADSRSRGLPPIGFRFRIPERIERLPLDPIALDVFAAGLLIDRDGALRQIANDAADAMIEPPASGEVTASGRIELDSGVSGHHVTIALSRDVGAGRYVTVLALAPLDLSVSACVLVVARMLRDSWPAVEEVLATLRVFGRGGENDQRIDEVGIDLPVLDGIVPVQ